MRPAKALSVPSILVIEDDKDTREMLSFFLRRNGFEVIEAADGVEGLLKASGKCPDLIITDLALPEMDGIEAARRIRRTPKLAGTPIFVLSSYLTVEVEAEVREAGCAAIFNKPFDPNVLLAKITSTLSAERFGPGIHTEFWSH
jgi:two-component system chemotaxis response regulator CheY